MPEVKSSSGKTVQVEVRGMAEVQRNLLAKNQNIEAGKDNWMAQCAGWFIENLQIDIYSYPSVDTGQFVNSITAGKLGEAAYLVYAGGTYPNGRRVGRVATWLEYGTVYITERRHFRNTAMAVKDDLRKIIANGLRQALNS